jgi:hypothetical protein
MQATAREPATIYGFRCPSTPVPVIPAARGAQPEVEDESRARDIRRARHAAKGGEYSPRPESVNEGFPQKNPGPGTARFV